MDYNGNPFNSLPRDTEGQDFAEKRTHPWNQRRCRTEDGYEMVYTLIR